MSTAQTAPVSPAAQPSYEPRDPMFFLLAVCVLAAALQAPGPHEADRDQAEASAKQLAAALDGGELPEGFLQPRHARELEELTELAVALSPSALNPTNPRTFTAGQQATARERAKARGLPIDVKAIEARKEQLTTNHAGLAKRLREISEPVRSAALNASATRLAGRGDMTGAPHLVHEALGVVVDEIERALRLAEGLKLPTRSLGTDKSENASNVAPYPASLVLSIFQAAREAESGDAPEVEVTYTEDELRAQLAAELAKAGKDRLASLATAPDKVGPALLTFASFVDEAEPGVISAPLRRALGLEARA